MKGRVAFAGASSKGLGLPAAAPLAAEGVSLARRARGEEALGAAAQRIRGRFEVDVPGQALDVTGFEAVTKFMNETRNRLGSVDICVTNAGRGEFGPLGWGPLLGESQMHHGRERPRRRRTSERSLSFC